MPSSAPTSSWGCPRPKSSQPNSSPGWAAKPIVFALANPTPEILPDEVKAARPDAIVATGRSDYPNQVNNVLCFPFLFRGALDVGATAINEEMKKAAVTALAGIAQSEASDIVLSAYGADTFVFGPDYIIPKPFDPRLIVEIAPAVARAAMETGVATRPIADFAEYREKLSAFVYRSGLFMRPVMDAAKRAPKRLVFAEGEHPYVLQATQQIIAEGLARPILVGRRGVIETRAKHLGLRLKAGKDFDLVDQENDPRLPQLTEEYARLVERRGVSPSHAQRVVRAGSTVIAGLLLRRGDADAMIGGAIGRFQTHLKHVEQVIGRHRDASQLATLSAIILPSTTLFIADTYVNYEPTAWQLADITLMAADKVRRFGIEPKVALLSHSNFGDEDNASAVKMRHLLELLRERAPELEVEGEMHADAALSPFIREEIFPNSRLKGAANLLIMPNRDAANIAFNLLKVVTDAVPGQPDPARRRQARAHRHAVDHRARAAEHGGVGRRRRAGGGGIGVSLSRSNLTFTKAVQCIPSMVTTMFCCGCGGRVGTTSPHSSKATKRANSICRGRRPAAWPAGSMRSSCPRKPRRAPIEPTDTIPYDVPLPPAPELTHAQRATFEMVSLLLRIAERSQGRVRLARSVADIRAAVAAGAHAPVLHIEGCEALDADLKMLDVLHAAGLRSLGPVWSRSNIFGHGVPFRFPADPDTGDGLTGAGKALIKRCNELRILIDLSHLNEKGFWDVARLSNAPLVATHSNAHALCASSRN